MEDVKSGLKCPRCGRTLTVGQESCQACLLSPAPGVSDPHPPIASAPLSVGVAFRGYEIREVLGSGGMGVVYKVRQVTLDRAAALKVLSPEYVRSPKFVQRFEREARVLASINHPNVVHVYDFGRHGDLLYLAMEYVDGATLQRRFDEAPGKDLVGLLRLMGGVCEGLERIHRAGLVHRDIKPSNILIPREGEAKISDFGLAIEADDSMKVTLTGSVIGTPHYMSPEQVLGKTVDGRSDLYSLGVLLYKGLTGRLPFEGASTAVLVRHVQEIPPSPCVLVPALPAMLDDLVMRMLAKAPEQRPVSAREVKEQLDAVLAELGALEAQGALVAAPAPRTAEHRRPAAAAAAKSIDLTVSNTMVLAAMVLVGLALAFSVVLVAFLILRSGG